MNKAIIIGRLTADPEVRQNESMVIARYTLAVDRTYKKDGEQTADFLPCVAFGKRGEFAEKWLHKGMKIAVTGRIQTGSYTNKDGFKVRTYDIIVDEQEFAESKQASQRASDQAEPQADGFVPIDDDLPFR